MFRLDFESLKLQNWKGTKMAQKCVFTWSDIFQNLGLQ